LFNRRRFIEAMAVGLLARPAVSDAQQAGRTWQLGILVSGSFPSSDNPYLDALEQGLDERGYAQGRNLSYVIRAAEGRSDRLSTLAAELVQLKVDAVVTIGSTLTIKRAVPC
jgi:ABC-type sugar transport system substrate-binding protein